MSTNKQYIPAIDGIRAIAVLLVILYHLDIDLFKGGFIGVDIFFVISGFLITRNIVSAYQEGSFSFRQFYVARLRRLYPALLVTVFVSLFFSFLLLSPKHFVEAANSSIAATLSVANIYFWNSAGYFDTQAVFKPLLHYWSLSVEEQFYLVWPAAFVLILSVIKSVMLQRMCILFVVGLSLVYTHSLLIEKPDLAFYWFHARIYEFLIGALLIGYSSKLLPYFIQWLLLGVGLIVIVIAAITYSDMTPFPGINALLPCLGAALLIYTREFSFTCILLANRLMRWIGKISYSLYLVHWPVWVFWGYWSFEPVTNLEKVILLIFIIILGYLLYILIERPFRKAKIIRSNVSNKPFIACIVLVSILICGLSYKVIDDKGMKWRVHGSDNILKFKRPICNVVENNNTKIKEKRCQFGDTVNVSKRVLLLGDSHAQHLIAGLNEISKTNGISVNAWIFSGCPPIWNTYKVYGLNNNKLVFKEKHCKSLIKEWKKEVHEGNYDAVILASRWAWLFESTTYGIQRAPLQRYLLVDDQEPEFTVESSKLQFKNKLKMTVEDIISSTKSSVIVFSQIPLLGKNIQGCDRVPRYLLASNMVSRRCLPRMGYSQMLERLSYTDGVINSLNSSNVLTITPSQLLCPLTLGECKTVWNERSIYYDDNHLNVNGSKYLMSSYKDQLLKFILHGQNSTL